MKTIRKILPYLFIAIILIVLGFAVWFIPLYLYPPTDKLPAGSKELIDVQNEYRKIFVQIIGGIAILYGLYLTARRTKAIEDTSRSQFEALKISEEGQITERFTRAVEQLGSGKLELRLGGIYALERIARDSAKDHLTVMEVLTAFLKEHTKISKEKKQQDRENRIKKKPSEYNIEEIESLPTDIQTAITVIGRRKWIEVEVKEKWYLEFYDLNIQRASFIGANLHEAEFLACRSSGSTILECQSSESKVLECQP